MNSNCIYIDYEDYPVLEDEFTKSEFNVAVSVKLATYNLGFLTSDSSLQTKIRALTQALVLPIYDEYHTDSLAYLDSGTFIDRMLNTLVRKVNRWIIQQKIEEQLFANGELDKYIVSGGTHSETSENASTGSAVIQKSASTPTGIQHNASQEDIEIHLDHNSADELTDLSVTDNYDDKYTNFVGKTNGLHRNEVDRDTDITRTSSYELALQIVERIPYSYIEDVLKAVSQHFIQVY